MITIELACPLTPTSTIQGWMGGRGRAEDIDEWALLCLTLYE